MFSYAWLTYAMIIDRIQIKGQGQGQFTKGHCRSLYAKIVNESCDTRFMIKYTELDSHGYCTIPPNDVF